MAELSTASTASSSNTQVRIVTTADYKQAALALAEAFWKDDVARYPIDVPDRAHWTDKQRWDLHLSLMEYLTYAHCLRGLVTAVGDDYGAVALWMPPKAHMDSITFLFRAGLWRLSYKLSPEGRRRMFKEFFPLLHDTKLSVLGSADRDRNSWYLVYLGTRPSARRNGYAKMLINHVLPQADAAGVPVYLESSNTVNVKYYQRFGFEVRTTIELLRSDEAIAMDIMVREVNGVKAEGAERAVKVHAEDGARGEAKMVELRVGPGENLNEAKTKALDIARKPNSSRFNDKNVADTGSCSSGAAMMEKRDSGVAGISA